MFKVIVNINFITQKHHLYTNFHFSRDTKVIIKSKGFHVRILDTFSCWFRLSTILHVQHFVNVSITEFGVFMCQKTQICILCFDDGMDFLFSLFLWSSTVLLCTTIPILLEANVSVSGYGKHDRKVECIFLVRMSC